MSKEDMEFLQNAFESVYVNKMKEIQKILEECKKREGDSKKNINERIDLLNLQFIFRQFEKCKKYCKKKKIK